jgi:hypothetical protein
MSEKTIAQKLLIKPGHRVLFINIPKGYEDRISKLPAGVVILKEPTIPVDVIQLFAANRLELEKYLEALKPHLTSKTILWVTYLKGTAKTKTDINRDSIATYVRSIGLVAVAIFSVDEDWAAVRVRLQ